MVENKAKNIGNKTENESGAVFVEAALVLPIVFFVLFFILFLGDVYYQMAKVDDIVARKAIKGAQCVKDPLLYDIIETGVIPTENDDIQPYRYLFGTYKELEEAILSEVMYEINHTGILLFEGMKPKIRNNGNTVRYINKVIYSTFYVDITYDIRFPIALFNEEALSVMTLSSRAEVAVNDAPEFLRNVDMVVDTLYGSAFAENIEKAFDKVNQFLMQFKNK